MKLFDLYRMDDLMDLWADIETAFPVLLPATKDTGDLYFEMFLLKSVSQAAILGTEWEYHRARYRIPELGRSREDLSGMTSVDLKMGIGSVMMAHLPHPDHRLDSLSIVRATDLATAAKFTLLLPGLVAEAQDMRAEA